MDDLKRSADLMAAFIKSVRERRMGEKLYPVLSIHPYLILILLTGALKIYQNKKEGPG